MREYSASAFDPLLLTPPSPAETAGLVPIRGLELTCRTIDSRAAMRSPPTPLKLSLATPACHLYISRSLPESCETLRLRIADAPKMPQNDDGRRPKTRGNNEDVRVGYA